MSVFLVPIQPADGGAATASEGKFLFPQHSPSRRSAFKWQPEMHFLEKKIMNVIREALYLY